ncbi:nucleoside-diphosphate sugar epimerase [Novosphingobium sp. Leaf2]|nr:nucleoside-diphosphate sugar epimerase [Novosphingobium sp. Leaf2]
MRLCLVGATGLVGRAICEQAISVPGIHVIGVGRPKAGAAANPCPEMLVAEPIDWPELIASANADVLVCALGTTIKAAGSRAQFNAIDHDLIRFVAEAALAGGIGHMILVSSVGADAHSSNFYLAVKGLTEAAVTRLGIRRLDILRPGLLRGKRAQRRGLETLGQLAAPLLDRVVLHGPLRRYRSIPANAVAKAALGLARDATPGAYVHEHDALIAAGLSLGST